MKNEEIAEDRLTKELQRAIEIATLAHANQFRRNGELYIFHVMRVASNKQFILSKQEQIVGILHDVVEDTPLTFDFLIEKGISKQTIEILKLLTRNKEQETYEEYITRICTNEIAMLVKLSDLHDNSDTKTLSDIQEQDWKRFETYEKAKLQIRSQLLKTSPYIFKQIEI